MATPLFCGMEPQPGRPRSSHCASLTMNRTSSLSAFPTQSMSPGVTSGKLLGADLDGASATATASASGLPDTFGQWHVRRSTWSERKEQASGLQQSPPQQTPQRTPQRTPQPSPTPEAEEAAASTAAKAAVVPVSQYLVARASDQDIVHILEAGIAQRRSSSSSNDDAVVGGKDPADDDDDDDGDDDDDEGAMIDCDEQPVICKRQPPRRHCWEAEDEDGRHGGGGFNNVDDIDEDNNDNDDGDEVGWEGQQPQMLRRDRGGPSRRDDLVDRPIQFEDTGRDPGCLGLQANGPSSQQQHALFRRSRCIDLGESDQEEEDRNIANDDFDDLQPSITASTGPGNRPRGSSSWARGFGASESSGPSSTNQPSQLQRRAAPEEGSSQDQPSRIQRADRHKLEESTFRCADGSDDDDDSQHETDEEVTRNLSSLMLASATASAAAAAAANVEANQVQAPAPAPAPSPPVSPSLSPSSCLLLDPASAREQEVCGDLSDEQTLEESLARDNDFCALHKELSGTLSSASVPSLGQPSLLRSKGGGLLGRPEGLPHRSPISRRSKHEIPTLHGWPQPLDSDIVSLPSGPGTDRQSVGGQSTYASITGAVHFFRPEHGHGENMSDVSTKTGRPDWNWSSRGDTILKERLEDEHLSCSEALEPPCSPYSNGSGMSASTPSLTITSGAGSPTHFGDSPRLLTELRACFMRFAQGASATLCLTRTRLFNRVRQLAEARLGLLDPAHLELLCDLVRRIYAEADLGLGLKKASEDGEVGLTEAEWLHYLLVWFSTSNFPAVSVLNRKLKMALSEDPTLLDKLLAIFEESASDAPAPTMLPGAWEVALATVLSQESQQKGLTTLDPEGCMGYFEFIARALGATEAPVELALYDLSQGLARWIPPALLGGRRFEGIWHSGVRVYGKEFWFGGIVLETSTESCPFGEATKVIKLGTTLRSRPELLDFIRSELYSDFNPKTYDVLRRNCNHFSNTIVQFLLPGVAVPEEVLLQPEWAQNARLVQTLRPFMNRWLGGFGNNVAQESPGVMGSIGETLGFGSRGSSKELKSLLAGDETGGEPASQNSPEDGSGTPRMRRRIDDLTEEWRARLKVGDMVLYRQSFTDRPVVARVWGTSGGTRRRTLDILLPQPASVSLDGPMPERSPGEQLWTWVFVQRQGVRTSDIFPFDPSDLNSHMVKAGPLLSDDSIVSVLRRKRPTATRPCCPRGHNLSLEPPVGWFRQAPPCSICSSSPSASSSSSSSSRASLPARSNWSRERQTLSQERCYCPRCTDFVVCRACLVRGQTLPGGGVFSDLMPDDLARALMSDPGWFRYRAQVYFWKADHNASGTIDRLKLRRVAGRICFEMKQPYDLDLTSELKNHAVDMDDSGGLSMSETQFQSCLRNMMTRAVGTSL